jgi:hypothetical protein
LEEGHSYGGRRMLRYTKVHLDQKQESSVSTSLGILRF